MFYDSRVTERDRESSLADDATFSGSEITRRLAEASKFLPSLERTRCHFWTRSNRVNGTEGEGHRSPMELVYEVTSIASKITRTVAAIIQNSPTIG